MQRRCYGFILLMLCVSFATAQHLRINEVMSANVTTLEDSDGEYPDWIELFNAGQQRIILKNFGLSDDRESPLKWQFPDIRLEPGSFLLVFASGKDVRAIPTHWETVADWGDQWKYLIPAVEPPANWRTVEFEDSQWQSGPSGFGYGDNDDSTDISPADPFQAPPNSIFVRKEFQIEIPDDITEAILHIDYDDGFVAYLNDIEIARSNLGFLNIPPAYDQLAEEAHEAKMYEGGAPEKFVIENIDSILRSGRNVLALQCHNVQLYSSDMTLIPFFTLGMVSPPPNARGASPHLTFPAASRLRTNFKIDAAGELVVLADNNGVVLDSVFTGGIPADHSRGRKPDGSADWFIFPEPTPGLSNTTQGFRTIAPAPETSLQGGFYNASLTIELTSPLPGAFIRYTLDGSVPRDTSSAYNSPLLIDSTTVVRARIFGAEMMPGETITNTYFINESVSLPVVSLSTDPANFWDHETGIYVFGDNADTVNYPYWGSNFWEDWERPLHIEYFEPDGRRCFGMDAGVKIFGSWSRLYPQKSLAIFARDRYGVDRMRYPIFPDKAISEYKSIVLRNSGQDWGRTFFRDAMLHYLVKNTDLDIQAYQPALVFLNGAFFGLHNIREKMNEHYLAANRGVDPDNIDFIERDTMIIHGDEQHYQNLLGYVSTHDMSETSAYEYVSTQMDIDNFILYTLTVIYYANSDWPWNNVKCWRPRTAEGKWKWLLFDLDYCFHGGHLGPDANVFNEMRNQDNGTTLLFFKLMTNKTFRNKFVNFFADHINITFDPDRVLRIIEQFKNGIEKELPRHIDRWKYSFVGPWWLGKSIDSMEEWYGHIEVPRAYALQRPEHMRRQLIEEFGLADGGQGTLSIAISPLDAGEIKVNSLVPDAFPWQGVYFTDIPIRLSAIAHPGYRFAGWEGVSAPDTASIEFNFTPDQHVVAVFEKSAITNDLMMINEINYKSASNFDTEDWVEFYNAGSNPVDISGWQFKDSEDSHAYTFPAGTIIDTGQFVVLCRDTVAFRQMHPDFPPCFGDMDFGLSSDGELIRLFDAKGELIDSLTFGAQAPWAETPKGSGPTLELIDPSSDNSQPQNWAASKQIGGTPGVRNSVLANVESDPGTVNQPSAFRLYQNFPNPFNAQTRIRLDLPQSEQVTLKIYSILGEEIATLLRCRLSAGQHSIQWDGDDKNGLPASSGVFFYRVDAGEFHRAGKMVLLR
ncbi:CotH kinase family protein [candidate division KSB1 bacterium]|nr:CotH kinase family protein [candidate division KSB1 bacterium]